MANKRAWTALVDGLALALYGFVLLLLAGALVSILIWPAWTEDQQRRRRALVDALSGMSD
jgi:hypothetical protein